MQLMTVPIYIAEERNYGPDDRVGSAIPPSRIFHSFEPIPKSERLVSYREGDRTFVRTIRVTGGQEPAIRVKAIGEMTAFAGPRCFQIPTGRCYRPADLLDLARSDSPRAQIVRPVVRPVERKLIVTFGNPPVGPILPTTQASFAW